jgi:outer membrane biosynthesis protein TonB
MPLASAHFTNAFTQGKNMAVMRDRLRILGALLTAALLGTQAPEATAAVTQRKKVTKKAAKKKATKKVAKKKATKKKATKKVAKKKATKKKATKKVAKKKVTKRKAKKKVAKRKVAKKKVARRTQVPEPGTAALLGAGLLAAGAAHKMGRRSVKKAPKPESTQS